MKRMEINGEGWRWMKRMEMDEEDGDKWIRIKVRVRDRVSC